MAHVSVVLVIFAAFVGFGSRTQSHGNHMDVTLESYGEFGEVREVREVREVESDDRSICEIRKDES